MGYRGQRKHLKRINAPHRWMLGKLNGIWAPKPTAGPHKQRDCMPLALLLRDRLKYALTMREVLQIVKDRAGLIRVDGKVRKDPRFPLGFMDVVNIEKTGEKFRILLDVKGRFAVHRVQNHEGSWKLLKVRRKGVGLNKVPYIVTHDGRTIRYPHPDVQVNDTVKFDFENSELKEHYKFAHGNAVIITGGHNIGRVGVITHTDKHPGSFEIVHVRDERGETFATRITNVFVIGTGKKPALSLPRGNGIKYSIIEERERRIRFDDEEEEDDD